MSKTVYLAGPMTGYEDFNYQSFHEAADFLREDGYDVINPAENFGGRQDLDYDVYMELAKCQVMHSDHVVLLAGWEQSGGVVDVEIPTAEKRGIPVSTFQEFTGLVGPFGVASKAEHEQL